MSGGGDNTTTQVVGPPDFLEPYYIQIADETMRAMGQVSRDPYTNDVVAQPNPIEQVGIADGVQFLQGNEPDAATAMDNANLAASGALVSPDSNPFLQEVINAAIRPAREQLTEQVLPSIGQSFQSSGAFGGSRQGVVEGQAIGDYLNQVTDISAQLYNDNYVRELDRMFSSPQLMSQALNIGMAESQAYNQLGMQEAALDQRVLDNLLAQYEINQVAPFAGLGEASSILSAGGFSSSEASGPSRTGQNALTGAAGGAAIGSAFGPWGTGIGAVLGGLGGLL